MSLFKKAGKNHPIYKSGSLVSTVSLPRKTDLTEPKDEAVDEQGREPQLNSDEVECPEATVVQTQGSHQE